MSTIDEFRNSQATRECTFQKGHDCKNCVKNLAVGSRQMAEDTTECSDQLQEAFFRTCHREMLRADGSALG